MFQINKEIWITNLENVASKVTTEFGIEVTKSIFQRYDAHGIYDLNPIYYSEVFTDLQMMVNDN